MSMPHDISRGAAAPARAIEDPIEAARPLGASGPMEEAIAVLSTSRDAAPAIHSLRGDIQFEMGRVEDAAESYMTVLGAQPNDYYARYNLALCLRRLERWESAALAFQEVLEFDPHRDHVRISLGDCLLHLNRFEEALACFDLCWSETARGPAVFGKAVVLQLLRRFDEAETIYSQLLGSPRFAEEALCNLIAISMEVFDLTRVERYALQLLEMCPQSTTALQGLTLVALERREYSAASRYFSRLMEHTPESGTTPPTRDGEAIEYRLSRDVVNRLNDTVDTARAATRAMSNPKPGLMRPGTLY
jgi:tetratricopeptide (TPR) repeat protein